MASSAPQKPYRPYAVVHESPKGPGDARPTSLQIIHDYKAQGTLRGRSVVITGCSSGIGVETARALYETGATLYLTARDVTRLESVIEDIIASSQAYKAAVEDQKPPRPVAVEIHLDSLESVRKGAKAINSQTDNVHILINNAGVMACPFSLTKDGYESQLATNHLAHFLLFQLLKPALSNSVSVHNVPSRIINVTSSGHQFSTVRFDDLHYQTRPEEYHKFGAYGQSKTANIYMTTTITRRHGMQGLIGLAVHPGGILDTSLGRHMDEKDWAVVNAMDGITTASKSQGQGAATTVWAAVEPRFGEARNGGRYLADAGECEMVRTGQAQKDNEYAAHAFDEEAEEKLWAISNELVGIQEA